MHSAPARVLALCLAAVVALSGQEGPPVFRAGTRLVEVTVTVLDQKDGAVTGLAASDFTLLDGGKPRPIAFFRFEGAPQTPAEAPPPAQGLFTNRVEVVRRSRRAISPRWCSIGLNTQVEAARRTRAQMMRYLKALTPETRVAIFHMGQTADPPCTTSPTTPPPCARGLDKVVPRARQLEERLETVREFRHRSRAIRRHVRRRPGDAGARRRDGG